MEPALRPEFTVDEIDGETVVAAEIDEVSASQKPCFYKNAGLPKGAYLRVGNTNRLIDGMFLRDITEYPRESLRESIANAVAHRDYSPYVRGSYIRVRMFADRLEVRSPGGLFGNVTVNNLEDEHSTRNARLMRMMEDMRMVENRGSGISAMLHAMREANLEPPRFDDRRASFKVT